MNKRPFPYKFINRLCLAAGINFILWEILLRFFVSSPCTQISAPQMGYMNLPEASFVYSSEGYSRGRFNSLGFNDNEPLVGEIVQRILVLGDSYTESFQVAGRDSYVQIFEYLLNQGREKKSIDVIKFARDGLTPAHYPLLLKQAAGLSPDVIVLQFWAHSGGDLYDDNIICRYTDSGVIQSIESRPRIEDKGKEKVRFIINHSALAYYTLRRFKPIIMRGVYSVLNFCEKKHTQTVRKSTLRTTEDMKARMVFILNRIRAASRKIVVFYIPEPGIFFRKNINEESQTLRALRRASQETGVLFVDLTNTFKEHYMKTFQPLNGFANTLPGTGHLNSLGHRIVAQRLFETVRGTLSK